jgi:lactonase family protein with 7-bladed beta-propeller
MHCDDELVRRRISDRRGSHLLAFGKAGDSLEKECHLSLIRSHCSLVLAVLAIAILSDCGSNHVGHVTYISLAGANQVAGYDANSSGQLSGIQGYPFSGGSFPEGIYIHPSRKFVYVANEGGGDISLFTIDSGSGALTESSSRTTAGTNPSALVMDSGGNFLFAANNGSNDVSVYSIDSTNGALTSVAGSLFPAGVKPLASLFLSTDICT